MMNPWTAAKIIANRAIAYMASLVTDGGPSTTRWMALRTTESMTMCVIACFGAVIFRVIRYGSCDGAFLTFVGGIAATLITATSLNQNTKLALDAKKPGDPSSISTPGATITTGEQPAKGAADDKD